MWLWLLAQAALAQEVVVEDPTGCVDRQAVQEALREVAGAREARLRLVGLPDGERVGLAATWTLTRGGAPAVVRELDVARGDCARLPTTLALLTERILSELEGSLEMEPARWEHGGGGLLRLGGLPVVPGAGLWTDHATRGPLGLGLGSALSVERQPVGAGAVVSGALEGRAVAVARTGLVRLDLGLAGGGVLGRGVRVDSPKTVLVPRFAVRGAAWIGRRPRLGLGLEVALIRPSWSVRGGFGAAAPPVGLQLQLGGISGER